MRVACVQADVVYGEPEANAARVVATLRELKAQDVDLAVFPECFLTGYAVDSREEAERIALPLTCRETTEVTRAPRPVVSIQEACVELGMHAVVGFAGNNGTDLYNGAGLIQADGTMHCYAKTHLPELGLDRFVVNGSELPVFETALGRIGILICFDVRVPEAARVLALKGADLIVVPTNWPQGAEFAPTFMCPVRANENRVFVAAANRVGTENGFTFIGKSGIWDPSGLVLASAGASAETIVADLNLAQAREKRVRVIPGRYETTVFDSRQPRLYTDLGL